MQAIEKNARLLAVEKQKSSHLETELVVQKAARSRWGGVDIHKMGLYILTRDEYAQDEQIWAKAKQKAEKKLKRAESALEECELELEECELELEQAESDCDHCRNGLRKALACLKNFIAIGEQEQLALDDE